MDITFENVLVVRLYDLVQKFCVGEGMKHEPSNSVALKSAEIFQEALKQEGVWI
jgi:hypothetical protein